MPSYAIKSSGIRQVAAGSLIGNSTGSTGSAEELSATDAKTLLGLGTSDSPTFAGLDIGDLAIDDSGSVVSIDAGTSRDLNLLVDANYDLSIYENNVPKVRFDTFSDSFQIAFGWSLGFGSSNSVGNNSSQIELTAINSLGVHNGTDSQTFSVYNSLNGSDYERGVFDWNTTSNTLTIGTEAAGTGTQRSVKVTGGGYTVIQGASGSELHQGGSRVLRCSGAAYFYKSAEPIGTINLGGSSSRWSNI